MSQNTLDASLIPACSRLCALLRARARLRRRTPPRSSSRHQPRDEEPTPASKPTHETSARTRAYTSSGEAGRARDLCRWWQRSHNGIVARETPPCRESSRPWGILAGRCCSRSATPRVLSSGEHATNVFSTGPREPENLGGRHSSRYAALPAAGSGSARTGSRGIRAVGTPGRPPTIRPTTSHHRSTVPHPPPRRAGGTPSHSATPVGGRRSRPHPESESPREPARTRAAHTSGSFSTRRGRRRTCLPR